jgi:hypothetical protein
MPKSRITQEGLNILNRSNASNAIHYWIGYYGLAYIPEGESLSDLSNGLLPANSKGDLIYNLFQGSLVPEGYYTDLGGERAATKLANECMYTSSVTTRYRYVLDEEDNNQLVVFASRDDGGFYNYHTYSLHKANPEENDALPVPAPLYYGGEPQKYDPAEGDKEVVSHDTRIYRAKKVDDQGHRDTGVGMDRYAWADSETNTYDTDDGFTFSGTDWQKQSISNFNRYHAPANTEGYAMNFDPACRNIAKATKLFPIAAYDVKGTLKTDATKVDTVQYHIDINMGDICEKINLRDVKYYDTKDGREAHNEKYKFGFRFNRIGIYAVEVTLNAFNKDSATEGLCSDNLIQMQIHGNSEPTLFGVIDLDEPIVMSEDTINTCQFQFNVQFTDPEGQVVTDTAVYHMLNEDDALTWYKNQLIANASTAEAVTSLGVQMNYLRHQIDNMGSGTTSCNIVSAGESANTTVVATSAVGNVFVDIGKLDLLSSTEEYNRVVKPFDNDEYLEVIDNIFSNGLSPIICYSENQYYKPGQASLTNGLIAYYATLCGVGQCTYMFYDAAHSVYIRIRKHQTTGQLYALAQYDHEPPYGYKYDQDEPVLPT